MTVYECDQCGSVLEMKASWKDDKTLFANGWIRTEAKNKKKKKRKTMVFCSKDCLVEHFS